MTRRLEARDRAVLPAAAVLLVLVLDWLWVGSARWASLVAARERLTALHVELTAVRREVAARADTRQAIREAARALRRAAARLPDERELGALLASVASGARDAGLELLLLRPGAERAAADHVAVPIELHGRGTYHGVLTFLGDLERLGRLVHLGDLRIDRPVQAGDRLLVEMRCTATTYRLAGARERAQAPPTGQPG
jgi:type IV pilus assembly protein PilO